MPRRNAAFKKPDYKDNVILTTIHSRNQWGANPPSREDPPLEHPISSIVLAGITVKKEDPAEKKRGRKKKEQIDFMAAVKQIQHRDMTEYKMADIQSNFVIAEDGTIFEARGWSIQPGRPNDYLGMEGKYLEIAYIGDCNTDRARSATGHLLEVGKNYKYMADHISVLRAEERRKPQLEGNVEYD